MYLKWEDGSVEQYRCTNESVDVDKVSFDDEMGVYSIETSVCSPGMKAEIVYMSCEWMLIPCNVQDCSASIEWDFSDVYDLDFLSRIVSAFLRKRKICITT